ncbi:MAG: transketolase [Candidatus Magasanikbacteria bacterium]|nr:transketolase [Candidatus Magasanikbacteria bacterium]
MANQEQLQKLVKLIRYYSLVSTTAAGSGHPTSSLSAADLMAVLMFSGFFRTDLDNHEYVNNDRLIFSKGHASPLFYSIYAAAGKVSEEEMLTLRKFGSRLEGHPTMAFPYTEVPTGSLGQGLSVGVGMALNAKLDKLPYRTWVLLGDSEMAEGSVWEAMASAEHYKLNNLVGIMDVNRLGQRGETMYGHHTEVYEQKARAFGWETIVIDGHNIDEIILAYTKAQQSPDKPVMIIAKTLKGKGVSFIEDKDAWHGKPLSAAELDQALKELGEVDKKIVGVVAKPEVAEISNIKYQISNQIQNLNYPTDKAVATRKAYGNALVRLAPKFNNVVVLDAEVSNSTYAELFKAKYPDRFFEMFIAEQNMVGTALGFSRRGKVPFISTFACFFTRAFDQIRMSQYANANIKFVGSHAGVSIGEDGASQMALEDLGMFRSIFNSVVLYPSDAISTERLVEAAAEHVGNVYIRTTRKESSILYGVDETFPIGGSKTLKSSDKDVVTVVGAGVTLHEALKAYNELQKEGMNIRVIDLYSIKPLDVATLEKAARETKAIITVEDHYAEGGIGEAVASVLGESLKVKGESLPVIRLAVRKMPKSGKPEELLAYEEIDAGAIVRKVKDLIVRE